MTRDRVLAASTVAMWAGIVLGPACLLMLGLAASSRAEQWVLRAWTAAFMACIVAMVAGLALRGLVSASATFARSAAQGRHRAARIAWGVQAACIAVLLARFFSIIEVSLLPQEAILLVWLAAFVWARQIAGTDTPLASRTSSGRSARAGVALSASRSRPYRR